MEVEVKKLGFNYDDYLDFDYKKRYQLIYLKIMFLLLLIISCFLTIFSIIPALAFFIAFPLILFPTIYIQYRIYSLNKKNEIFQFESGFLKGNSLSVEQKEKNQLLDKISILEKLIDEKDVEINKLISDLEEHESFIVKLQNSRNELNEKILVLTDELKTWRTDCIRAKQCETRLFQINQSLFKEKTDMQEKIKKIEEQKAEIDGNEDLNNKK
jgi:hypothetical protein